MKINDIKTRTFYHVTKEDNWPSIKQNGLAASIGERSAKMSEDEGIFLFGSWDDLENAVMNWLGDEFEEDSLIAIKIKLPLSFPIKHNANAAFEYITKKNIPPEYIAAKYKI